MNRAERAAEVLAGLSRAAAPGERLGTKEELRQACGVSAGTFNEALRLLQARGLVTVRPGPGGGLFAAEQSPMVRLGTTMLALDSGASEVADAIRVRDALEPLLFEDALWHGSPADFAELRACLETMKRAAGATAFVRANWALHARIAEISPSPLLRSLYLSLLDVIGSRTVSMAEPDPGYLAARHRLHERLVEALERRDREAVAALLAEHAVSG
ncbi:FadR/GntR family transcriptional regulator [Nonomuraea sp. NPDC050328]|uniref:FadR/GntR family transcriptional regulator n=1 Tax=Nonomuraea sp. NPDC050328 TaxID=3364361 RepID=UPI00378A5731